eukprot:CAMPEP_0198592542 /NCGR_PEP_ID=MMETSP1462-20131121/138274_1 /TAXON_ID=1333877 /ORGANISM="Brandtodinium nutriculum, Strain RCC3387" /LENGTH=88 /DNA_ID=CAMNT_0044324123 /DNA_START=132 /DNA_END=394 /DNA_ORIENTATION=+
MAEALRVLRLCWWRLNDGHDKDVVTDYRNELVRTWQEAHQGQGRLQAKWTQEQAGEARDAAYAAAAWFGVEQNFRKNGMDPAAAAAAA